MRACASVRVRAWAGVRVAGARAGECAGAGERMGAGASAGRAVRTDRGYLERLVWWVRVARRGGGP